MNDRPLIGTYTMLNTFKNVCEHQMYRRYIKRDQPYIETEAMRWGNVVHSAMKNRVDAGIVLPDDMKHWEPYAQAFDQFDVLTELQLGINRQGAPVDFWAPDVWFRGKLDNTVIVNNKALLTDWKTGSSRFEDPFELETNALLLRAKYPNLLAIVGRYVYLKENKLGAMHDLTNTAQTFVKIDAMLTAIASKRQVGDWVKRKSGLCGYCSVKDCENYFIARP